MGTREELIQLASLPGIPESAHERLREHLAGLDDEGVVDFFCDLGLATQDLMLLAGRAWNWTPWRYQNAACLMVLDKLERGSLRRRVNALAHEWLEAMRHDCVKNGYPTDERIN